jgi:hypothetical protein
MSKKEAQIITRLWNYKIGAMEDVTEETSLRDFIPQNEKLLRLYDDFIILGYGHYHALSKALEEVVSPRRSAYE